MGSTIAHRTRTMTFSFGAIRIPVANVRSSLAVLTHTRRHRAIYTNTRHTLTHTRQLQVFCMPFDSDTFTFIKNATSDFQGDRFRQNYGFTLPCAIPLQTIYSVVCQMLVCCCFDWVVGRLAEWFQVDFWLKFVVNSYFVCDVWNMLRARNVTQWRAHTHTHKRNPVTFWNRQHSMLLHFGWFVFLLLSRWHCHKSLPSLFSAYI